MVKAVRAVIGLAVLGVVGAFVVFLVGVRLKYPPVINAVRRFARDVGNPRVLQSAGTPGAEAGIIHHVGRTSGKAYQTPISALPTEEGFVIALPYGQATDWLKNVRAAGSAVLVHEGQTYQVDRPEVVPRSDAARFFSAREQRTLRLFGVDECLLLRRADLPDASVGGDEAQHR